MSTGINPLPSLLRASAQDAGNRRMRSQCRHKWDEGDWNKAAATFNRLRSACYGDGPEGCIKFQIAEELQKAGHLTLDMKGADLFALVDGVNRAICEHVA